MAFNTAVSGLRAANADLSVIGNNIANASTTGFKQSRAEFGDIYAAAAFGGGGSSIGSGVFLNAVTQQHNQGNISFTNNGLDMAINGNGYFITSNNGAFEYTRSGLLGLDQEGFMVNSQGKRLQGFPASDSGAISGSLSDLQIVSTNLAPEQSTDISITVNIDASETEPAERGTTVQTTGAVIGVAIAGVSNGYSSEELTFTSSDASTRVLDTTVNASAKSTASAINALAEVSATASTSATLSAITDGGALELTLNGVALVDSADYASAITAQDIAIAINSLTNTTLRGVTATFSGTTVNVTSTDGEDLSFSIANTAGDGISVTGSAGATVALAGGGTLAATVGGTVNVVMEENVSITTDGAGAELFPGTINAAPFVNNAFDPDDQDTYNHATSVNVFDSLGNSHVMNLYFVKESTPNTWSLYTLIDGFDVGDPNQALPPPQDQDPTRASYSLVFNDDGTLDATSSDPVRVTYWSPLDADGNPNGALSGLAVADGALFPLVEPYNSSNFEVDVTKLTQYGSPFSVNDVSQNGYATGRLTAVDITADGTIFTRYTNGQSRSLGQVAIANFRNPQGLQPIGNTAWAETFDSGNPVVGVPGSASLGLVQSGALEESNVDLSQELVSLIIAQRNFQANAKTIQTEDAVTQTIINMR